MMFQTSLMADPVVASDGFTYERESIVLWMKSHDTSPTTRESFEHKVLIPNHVMRRQITAWCEQHGMPAPSPSTPAAQPATAHEGNAAALLLQKPVAMCQRHPREQMRVFCLDCNHSICVICAIDSDVCKPHTTKAFEPLLDELRADREGLERAQRECEEGVEQLCAAIQADGDMKIRGYTDAIAAHVVELQQRVRSAAAARSSAIGALVQKRRDREELVAAAAASFEVAVKDSAAAALISAAFHCPKAVVAPATAAQFLAAEAPSGSVGELLISAAVVDPEDEAAKASAAAAAATAAVGALSGSALMRRVADQNKAYQFYALLRNRLADKSYRLLYTNSSDGQSNAAFHQHCDNQVRCKVFSVYSLTLSCRVPRL